MAGECSGPIGPDGVPVVQANPDWDNAAALNRTWTDVTVAANAVTLTNDGKYRVTSCATDLQTINGTTTGDVIVLSIDDVGCGSLTVRDNLGNIQLPGDQDVILASSEHHLLLIHKGGLLAPAVTQTITKANISFAFCSGGSGLAGFDDSPLLTEPSVACVNGTNKSFGVADFDDATDEGFQVSFVLPNDYISIAQFDLYWQAAATSGSVVWVLQTLCVAVGETPDPSFNAAQAVADTAQSTANQRNQASITTVTTTGCSAGDQFTAQISRDGNGSLGPDTMSGDARGIDAVFTLIRSR